MLVRIVVGILAALFLLAVVLLDWWVLAAVVVLISLIAVYEMWRTLKQKEVRLLLIPLVGYCLLMWPAYLFLGAWGIISLLMFAAFGTMSAIVFSAKITARDCLMTLGTLIYPLLPLTYLMALSMLEQSALRQLIIIQACVCTYLGDTFALFTGMLLGKHKLCERLSPKKTVEGFYGGLVGSILGGVIMLLLDHPLFGVEVAWYHGILIAFLCGVLGVLGDLFASSIKRYAGVKDFGNLLPGHGGILDRIDSLLFTLPVVIIYYQILIL